MRQSAAADALNPKLHLPESKAVFANGILNDELEFVDGNSDGRDVYGKRATDVDLICEPVKATGLTHYLIVETKADDDENQLRGVERIKIACARKYFDATANGSVQYAVVKSYRQLTDILRGD